MQLSLGPIEFSYFKWTLVFLVLSSSVSYILEYSYILHFSEYKYQEWSP